MKGLWNILRTILLMIAFVLGVIVFFCVPFFYLGVKLVAVIPFEILKYVCAMVLFCVFFVLARKICQWLVPKILRNDD